MVKRRPVIVRAHGNAEVGKDRLEGNKGTVQKLRAHYGSGAVVPRAGALTPGFLERGKASVISASAETAGSRPPLAGDSASVSDMFNHVFNKGAAQ